MIEIQHLYVATVEDNDDPTKGGQVQVSIGLFDWLPEHYPWVRPWKMGMGASTNFGKSEIPVVGSKIWVFFSDELRKENGFYLADAEFLNLHPHQVFENKIKQFIRLGVNENADLKYPSVKFVAYRNGLCTFVCDDPDNPFFGVFHPSGSQFIIDKKGEAYVGTKGQTPDKVVSTTKLKAYLAPIIGNFGAPLFTTIGDADLGFDHFFAGLGTVPPINIPPVPESLGEEGIFSPEFDNAV